MGLTNQIGAYDDCFEVFERANADPQGIRVQFETDKAASFFMFRLHHARGLMRAESKRLYKREDAAWGKSAFDGLVVRRPREDAVGLWWIYIEKYATTLGVIESLADAPPKDDLILEAKFTTITEPKALPAPEPSSPLPPVLRRLT